MTLNELQPQAQTHSKSGAITNMPRLLSTPLQTPAGDFPAKGSGAQVSPATDPKGMPTELVGGLHAGILNWASLFPTLPSRTLRTLSNMGWG